MCKVKSKSFNTKVVITLSFVFFRMDSWCVVSRVQFQYSYLDWHGTPLDMSLRSMSYSKGPLTTGDNVLFPSFPSHIDLVITSEDTEQTKGNVSQV